MANDRTVNGAGFQLVIASGSVSKKIQDAIMDGLVDVGEAYRKQVIRAISFSDHTLQELREMGYPYSTRFGEGSGPHGDDRIVHEQDGKLKQSIKISKPEETTTRRFSVFVTSDVPYMPFLIYGTSRMRARRFHEYALNQMKDVLFEPVLKNLKNVSHSIQTTQRV